MQNSRLTTKLRSALGFESLAFVYAFLLAGSLGAQSVYTPYTFTTLAGLAGNPGSDDGTGSAARFFHPFGVATDSSGNVYVADTGNAAVRVVTPGGQVRTLAGDGTVGSADSPHARFKGLAGIVVDGTSIYIYVADTRNHRIRRLDAIGTVFTIAGSDRGFSDGAAPSAHFARPSGIAIDGAGNSAQRTR